MVKIGVIKEGKIPQDTRVPLIPKHIADLTENHPEISVTVQPSDIRCYTDKEYKDLGIILSNNMKEADVLLGVKEVPLVDLIPNKTYMFFSHTTKEQSYNRGLLREVLKKNITLIDYEHLTDDKGIRIVAFGRYAGIVGAYNGLLTYGKKFNLYQLRRAHECFDLTDLMTELPKISLPPVKILVTGGGRVAGGAMEILDGAGIRKVSPDELLSNRYEEAVYANLLPEHYNKPKTNKPYSDSNFFANPKDYEGNFLRFAAVADLLIAGAFWDPQAPVLFTKDDLKEGKIGLQVIADITCDIEGSIPTTIRPCTIAEPYFDYSIETMAEAAAFVDLKNITVMSIDNLPNELPRNASQDFGRELVNRVLPFFVTGDKEGVLERATIARGGQLTDKYKYLEGFVNGEK